MTAFVTNAGSGGATFEADTEGSANWPLTKTGWGAQGSGQRVTLLQPLPIQPAGTNFFFSASGQNTTTTQLASAATFTGTIESTQSQQAISILLTTDQPGTLTVNQFIDSGGTFKTNTYVFNILAGIPFSENFTANGNYAQVVFKNTGASTTTTLNLNTAYGTLPAVDNFGNSPVSLPMAPTTYNVAGVIAINTILSTVDCINASGVSIQCSAMGTTGVVTPQWSNDGVNYIAQSVLTTAGVAAATITAAGIWTSPAHARFLQLKLTTATTAGTTTFAVQALPVYTGTVQAQTVVQPTAASFNAQATINGTGGLAATKAASTAAAATDIASVVSLSPNSPITLPTATTSSIINSAATTNATSVKASAGTVYSVTASNTGAAAAFVKLYNLATAPTVGTSTIAITISVPAGGTVNLPFGTSGARFATGIGLAITNLAADTDTTAVVAAQVKVITAYI
jgi:hypothetical protein